MLNGQTRIFALHLKLLNSIYFIRTSEQYLYTKVDSRQTFKHHAHAASCELEKSASSTRVCNSFLTPSFPRRMVVRLGEAQEQLYIGLPALLLEY